MRSRLQTVRVAPIAHPSAGLGSVRFTSPGAVLEISVLDRGLIRLRAARGRRFPGTASRAVVEATRPVNAPIQIRDGADGVVLCGDDWEMKFDRASGAWVLLDRARLAVFESPPGGLRFEGPKPTIRFTLAEREVLLGLGETTGPLNKRGLVRELWNTDVLGHAGVMHPGLRRMYVSIPFLLSLRDGRCAGLFWDNPTRQVWDLGCGQDELLQVTAEGGAIDLYLFMGPTPADLLRRYTALTGRMPMPPRWGLGYHQCRHSYASRVELEAVAEEFRRRRIPCDALYLDIGHLRDKKVFTFSRRFPRPAEMLRHLRRRGFRVVAIVNPGVADDPTFGVLRRGKAVGAFVKRPHGRGDYLARVWAGRSRFPDFLNARVRHWWGKEQARLQRLGVAGFWNDMNEPATFDSSHRTLDLRCRHQTDDGPARHADVHNLYGMAMAQASREGALAADPAVRPLVISRAGYAGIQRQALVWTGDNQSCWEHLAESVPMLLNLGLSGVAFCGSDVGGFQDDCTGELLARWTQLAAFTPFFRNHSNENTRAQEPWRFGPKVQAICRRYIEMRYQLLPYLYGLFLEAHREGTPVMRALAWHFPNDPTAVACDDQFLLGEDLLVAPVVRPGVRARSVYLPTGTWYDAWTGRRYHGRQQILATTDLETIPLFVRAGAVLPMIAAKHHTGGGYPPTVNLHVWSGGAGECRWYEDDGESHGFVRGEFHERAIRFRPSVLGGELVWDMGAGSRRSRVRTWRVLLRVATRPYRVWVNRQRAVGEWIPELALFVFEVANVPGEFRARWY